MKCSQWSCESQSRRNLGVQRKLVSPQVIWWNYKNILNLFRDEYDSDERQQLQWWMYNICVRITTLFGFKKITHCHFSFSSTLTFSFIWKVHFFLALLIYLHLSHGSSSSFFSSFIFHTFPFNLPLLSSHMCFLLFFLLLPNTYDSCFSSPLIVLQVY